MRILYINIHRGNARDITTIRGLRENSVEVTELTDNTAGWKKFYGITKKYYRQGRGVDLIIIGYTGAIFVPLLRLISGKKVIYNALAPLSDGMITSRDGGKKFTLRFFKYWLIDWLAFHLAHKTIVESEAQKKFVAKTFFLKPEKIVVNYTGVDDHSFFFDLQIKKLEIFTAVFRGKFLPEAGVDVLIRAAKELERHNIKVRIIGHGLLEKEIRALIAELRPTNLELITERLPITVLRQKMQECYLSIGQVANHPRLERTIPHKVFESLALKLPYLTSRQPAILELLTEDKNCFCVRPGSWQELSDKILELKNQPALLEMVAKNGFVLYQETFTSKILGRKLRARITTLI